MSKNINTKGSTTRTLIANDIKKKMRHKFGISFHYTPWLWHFFPLHCRCLHHDEAFASWNQRTSIALKPQNNKQLLFIYLLLTSNPKHVNAMHMFRLWDARPIGASDGFCKTDAYTCQGITCVYERSETRLGGVLSISLWTTLPGGQDLTYPGACPSWYPSITLIPAQHWNFCSLSPPLQLRKGRGVCGGGWGGGFGSTRPASPQI
jgi:hypothetical protein